MVQQPGFPSGAGLLRCWSEHVDSDAIMVTMAQWGVPGWHDDAACRWHDHPDIFFPETGAAGVVQANAAKAVCAGCVVRSMCLADALADRPGKDWGIRGGTTENEREDMRKGRRAVPGAARLAAAEMIQIGDQDEAGRTA